MVYFANRNVFGKYENAKDKVADTDAYALISYYQTQTAIML